MSFVDFVEIERPRKRHIWPRVYKSNPPCAPPEWTLKQQRTLEIVVVNADRSDFVNIKPIWYPVPGLPDNTPPREE